MMPSTVSLTGLANMSLMCGKRSRNKNDMASRTNPDVICADFLIPGADPKIYEEVNLTDLQNIVEDYLSEYNAESKQPMQLVMFKDALLHVVRISRVLRQPSGHSLLLGVGAVVVNRSLA
eukprot:scaffold2554_cov170-Ochromonas_danica.AAC.3